MQTKLRQIDVPCNGAKHLSRRTGERPIATTETASGTEHDSTVLRSCRNFDDDKTRDITMSNGG